MRYEINWKEDVQLDDGTWLKLRLIRPADKELLLQGFERLSEQSRYRRFLAPKRTLNVDELRYLTEVDGVRHFALGAILHDDKTNKSRGLGIARFVVIGEDAGIAEAAVAVADEIQGRGLGRILLDRLVEAALERGIHHFRCEVLANNVSMLTLVEKIGETRRVDYDGVALTVDVALPPNVPVPAAAALDKPPIFRLLSLVASGLVDVRNFIDRLRVSLTGKDHDV